MDDPEYGSGCCPANGSAGSQCQQRRFLLIDFFFRFNISIIAVSRGEIQPVQPVQPVQSTSHLTSKVPAP
ncbi:MAG: hypothetical protein WBW79_11700 [Desulfocapsaceae bacterium]